MGAFSDVAAALRRLDAAGREEGFNGFDAALCDGRLDRFLLEAFAVAAPALAPFALTDFLTVFWAALADFAAAFRVGEVFAGEVLGDFLRDFLDIRLPFVAFSGSIIRLLRVLSGEGESGQWLGKCDGPILTALGYGYKEFDAQPVRSLSEPHAG
jgi:hypothetical protein